MTASVPSICPIIASPWPRPITTIVGVARLAARKAVKQQMKDAGLKPAWIEHAVIVAAANDYLDKHWDELLEEATETIARWPPLSDRQQLTKAVASLAAGDVLLVTRLDRLARSTKDLLNTLDAIAKAGAGFRSLADTWADTTTPHGKLILTVLGGLAEYERSLILARTGEGRSRAQARGVRFGRKPKLTPHQIAEARRRREAGEALVEIGRSYNVSHSTISRL